MIEKAVIPAAGLGTRLLPITKELPKEMLPLYSTEANGEVVLKPLLHMVFEQIYDVGIREFCFIVGRGKRAIEDYFTPDENFLENLRQRSKTFYVNLLRTFYNKVSKSTLVWINQDKPLGFGDAVLRSRPFVSNKPFIVHAGDVYIYSPNNHHLKKLIETFDEYSASCVFFTKRVEDPRLYGVAEIEKEVEERVYKIKRVIEKPKQPPTNLAIVAVYAFSPKIFDYLDKTPLGPRGEKELTDAIQLLIEEEGDAYSIELGEKDFWLDIGNPKSYWSAIELSYKLALNKGEIY